MSGRYREACEEYMRLLKEAHDLGRMPPSGTWLSVCAAYGLDPRKEYAPKAGYLKCPICGVSRPYALIPLEEEGICTEWHLHPSGEAEKFPVMKNFEYSCGIAGGKLSLEDVAKTSLRVTEIKKWTKNSGKSVQQLSLLGRTKK